MVEVKLTPDRRRPQGFGWVVVEMNEHYTAWQNGIYCALSSVVHVFDDHQPEHWEWLVSFSNMGKQRLTNEQIKFCLKAFDAENFEEDNHESGIARKFWLAIDEKYRKPCPCKDEMVITEGDYQYSVKKSTNTGRA